MARYMRRQPQTDQHSQLSPPRVIGAGIVFRPIDTTLVAVRRRIRQKRYDVQSRLRPPEVVTPVATQIYLGPQITYWTAVKSKQNTALNRRQGTSRLGKPIIAAEPLAKPIDTTLFAVRRRVRQPRYEVVSRLRPPAVVTEAAVFFGPTVHLVRGRAGRTFYRGITPVLVDDSPQVFRLTVKLAPAGRRQTRSRLGPPVLAVSVAVYYGPQTHLVRARRPVTRPRLGPPVIPPVARPIEVTLTRIRPRRTTTALGVFPPQAVVHAPVQTHLAYSRRGQPLSFLRPFATGAFDVYRGPLTHLTYSRRGAPISTLGVFPPQAVVHAPITITLVRIRPPQRAALLRPPTVVQPAGQVFYGPSTSLAYSRRGRPLSQLRPPTVVFTAVELFGPEVSLARIRPARTLAVLFEPVGEEVIYFAPAVTLAPSRRPVTISILGVFPPQAVVHAPLNVHLTYSRRGKPVSFLRGFPTGAFDVYEGPTVHLAYSRRGTPKPRLAPPTVVAAAAVFYGPLTHLVRIRPRPTVHLLGVFPPQAVVYAPVQVHLTYSVRGKPKSFLRQPPFVLAPFAPITTSLARNKPKRTVAVLREPTVVQPRTLLFFGPKTSLAYSRRGKPKSTLRPPRVIGAGRFFRGLLVNLVTDRKRIAQERVLQRAPHSVLRPPVVLRLQEFDLSLRRIRKELAYSLRGRPQHDLRPPVVVRTAVEIYGPETSLAPSRFPRPISLLQPPRVVDYPPFRGLVVSLAPSRFPTPKPQLQPPAVVGKAPFRGILTHLTRNAPRPTVALIKPPTKVRVPEAGLVRVTLTRITPRPTVSLIRPPAVVRVPTTGVVRVSLTRITVPPTTSFLRPPTEVGAGVAFFGPQTTLVTITHPPVQWLLKPPTVVITEQPGDVECEDSTPYDVDCNTDTDTDQAQAVTTSAGTVVAGSTAAVADSADGTTTASGDTVRGIDREA